MMSIRIAQISDAPAILTIYQAYVEKTAITFESETPSLPEFEERMRQISSKYPFLVLEENQQIVGYAYANALNKRQAYDWSCEVTIYLAPTMAKKGYGRQLYSELEALLKKMGILNLYACIAFPEIDDQYLTHNSVEFHRHVGYETVGIFHHCGYKFDQWYHVMWMEKIIGEKKIPMASITPFPNVN